MRHKFIRSIRTGNNKLDNEKNETENQNQIQTFSLATKETTEKKQKRRLLTQRHKNDSLHWPINISENGENG